MEREEREDRESQSWVELMRSSEREKLKEHKAMYDTHCTRQNRKLVDLQ